MPLFTPLEYKAIEANGKESSVRKALAELLSKGISQIAHDEHEAVACALHIERTLGIEPNLALIRWQKTNRKGYWTPDPELPLLSERPEHSPGGPNK